MGADITAPATTAGLVALVGDELGRVTALTIADGSTEWTTTLDSSITASPIAAGGLVLVPTAADGGTLVRPVPRQKLIVSVSVFSSRPTWAFFRVSFAQAFDCVVVETIGAAWHSVNYYHHQTQ